MTDPDPALRTPLSPWLVGLAGVIPFAALAGLYLVGDKTTGAEAARALLVYAATILSFLGGVRWGAEIARAPTPRIGVVVASVVPALIAWALVAGPLDLPVQLGGLLAAFIGVWLWDARSQTLPQWYRRLRVALTLGAGLSLLAALVGAVQDG